MKAMADGMAIERPSRLSGLQSTWGERAHWRGQRGRAGTGGPDSGPGGASRWRLRAADRRDLAVGWVVILGLVAVATVVNALSAQADFPRVARWKPWVWEATSTAMLTLLAWLPWLTATLVRPGRLNQGWPARLGFVAAHLGAVLVFSALHVAAMVALRKGVYAAMGATYDYGLGERFVYELRKDLLTYVIFVAVFWLAGRGRQAHKAPVRPPSFDIRDGARLIRTPLDDIVAATSAGNYVEFVLADGRRPLMRATLAAMEAELRDFGFVRTHRSWLVNARRITGMRRDGSGDWTLDLGGTEAPLSRRYPDALARMKRGAG